jgi:hypothetical protein
MNITKIRQMAALQPNEVGRSATNIHLTATDFARFRQLAKTCGVNFSGLVRAALRTLEIQFNRAPTHEHE